MTREHPIELVLDRLDNVRQNGSGWTGRCPAHEDRQNSLSIAEGTNGRVLMKCFRGCTFVEIVAAMKLEPPDLFPADGGGQGGDPRPRSGREHSNADSGGLTLGEYAEAKGLPEAFLRSLGVTQIYLDGRPTVRVPYRHLDGTEAAVRFRLALGGENRFRWKSGSKPTLYGLSFLDRARDAGHVVLVEDESDCHTLWCHGVPALGLPGAGTWREDRDAPHFDGIPLIYVLIEPDGGGEAVKKWLAGSSIRDRVRLVSLEGHKDPSELHVSDPDAFAERWQQAIATALPWTEIEREAQDEAAAQAFAGAADLLADPLLLDRVRDVMRARGYAGHLNPPLIAYVGISSRLLLRPMNVVFVAPSGAGKNRAVDTAAELVPPEAIHVVKAGSARALVYAEESFEHRVVVYSEADSIPEDGPAASAVRSLAEDNSLAYDVVEQSPLTGRWQTRHIVKPGPTSLITTSTRSLREQMGTRVLEVSIPDDPRQTRNILKAHARGAVPSRAEVVDLAPFHALQTWLKLAGERQVAVPFAAVLAELVPATAVRMRRDFRELLTCIQTVALLYQCQRPRTREGWVEASIEDYATARDLLSPIFDTAAAEGVTAAVRETVEAVNEGEEISEAELARRLKLSKATVSYRVKRCLRGGWLVNGEQRKGQPAKLSRGVPLPEAMTALPTPERVREVFERSNANDDE